MRNGNNAQRDLLNYQSILILDEDEIHTQTQLCGFRTLQRTAICIFIRGQESFLHQPQKSSLKYASSQFIAKIGPITLQSFLL